VRPEEFYWPCSRPGDLVGSVLPHHEASSRWLVAPPQDPLSALRPVLQDNRLPVLAVDNYHLPFRPAYHDVHAAHLLVVYELGTDSVAVCDSMPPAYQGRLPVADLLRSWRSTNPRDHQDVFFSGSGIDARWLDVRLGTPFPELTADRLVPALAANVRGFGDQHDQHGQHGHRVGLTGLRRFTAELVQRAERGDGTALAQAYTFGWGMQAQAELHGELLGRCGAQWQAPALAEAGRLVAKVARCWTGLRVTAAHGTVEPARWVDHLARHGERLRRAYEEAVESVDRVSVSW
jgi:hypothetical protein